MIGLLSFVLAVLASPFKSKLRPEAENAVLRHKLMVLRRRLPGRVRFTNPDRWLLVQSYRWFPSLLNVRTTILDLPHHSRIWLPSASENLVRKRDERQALSSARFVRGIIQRIAWYRLPAIFALDQPLRRFAPKLVGRASENVSLSDAGLAERPRPRTVRKRR